MVGRRRGSSDLGVWGQSSPSCLERAGLSRGAGQRDAATFTFPYVFLPPPLGCSIFSSLSRLGGAAGGGCAVRCECACLSGTAIWDPYRIFPINNEGFRKKEKKSGFRASSLLAAAQARSGGPMEHFI